MGPFPLYIVTSVDSCPCFGSIVHCLLHGCMEGYDESGAPALK